MSKLGHLFRDLHDDQSGAAMIEYSVLLGVILAVTVAVIVAVGSWAGSKWTQLNSSLYG
jgi:pilus assembly protein Flp/PilA